MRDKVKTALRNLGVSAASLLIALLIGEGLLRAIGFSFSFAPERVEFGWPNPKVMVDRFETDADVFWVPRDYFAKLDDLREARPDLLFLGDSTTEFGYFPDLFLRSAGLRHPDHPLVGANLGVSGWSSYQGLQQFERDIVPLRPRYVTIFYGWNDHWIGFGVEDKELAPVAAIDSGGLRLSQLALNAQLGLLVRKRSHRPERVAPEDLRRNLREFSRLA